MIYSRWYLVDWIKSCGFFLVSLRKGCHDTVLRGRHVVMNVMDMMFKFGSIKL